MPSIGKNRGREPAQSRNTTPMSTASTEHGSTARLATPVAASWNELLDVSRASGTPHSSKLKNILESVKGFSALAAERVEQHDKGMRDCAKRKKEQLERQHELALKIEEEVETERLREVASHKKEQEERLPAIGAHSLAPQDGRHAQDERARPVKLGTSPEIGIYRSRQLLLPKPASRSESVIIDESSADFFTQADTAPKDVQMGDGPEGSKAIADVIMVPPVGAAESARSSSPEPVQPRPAPAIPRFQTFGPDPSTFDDPTVYHIRDFDETTTEDEKKDILGVADYPAENLKDLTCGEPPDRDLYNAKPPQQITWQTYTAWLDPYFRNITEEDLNFLKERGDRSGPMVIPPRGSRGYKEIWAEEDNPGFSDSTFSTPLHLTATGDSNGSMEHINGDMTDANASGPGDIVSRLMQLLRPERRVPPAETTVGESFNGDTTMTGLGGDESMFDMSFPPLSADPQPPAQQPLPPATALPDATNARTTANRPSWEDMDERVLRELRYIGFHGPDEKPDFEGHHDDEIAARLRFLQGELQRVSVVNGARKARLLQLVGDEMARQEWTGIQDDLDTQLNSAYGKRHRNTGKSKGKLKRAGAAVSYAGSATAAGVNGSEGRAKVGDPIRQLMDRRNLWRDYLGPAVDYGRRVVPAESVFGEDDSKMLAYVAAEKELWDVQDGG